MDCENTEVRRSPPPPARCPTLHDIDVNLADLTEKLVTLRGRAASLLTSLHPIAGLLDGPAKIHGAEPSDQAILTRMDMTMGRALDEAERLSDAIGRLEYAITGCNSTLSGQPVEFRRMS